MERVKLLNHCALGALLSMIVQACGGGSADSASDTDGCMDSVDEPVSVPASAVEGLPTIDGNYSIAACTELCASETNDVASLLGCSGDVSRSSHAAIGSSDGGSSSESGSSSDEGGSTGEPEATVVVICTFANYDCEVGGRLSDALVSDGHREHDDGVAAWFAAMAHAEAASVVSFVRLAAALAEHGAPAELIASCRDAARDEARHTRVMRSHARARGLEPTRPCHRAIVMPTLEALARENAIEGCVRETWAAAQIVWQAGRAEHPRLRKELAIIARDEVRHAELAWAIDAWARTRLDPGAIARIDHAQADAAAELARDGVSARELEGLGLPSHADARRLADSLRAALWS
jgi:hypothetical protein